MILELKFQIILQQSYLRSLKFQLKGKDLIKLGANKIDYLENYNLKSFKKIKKPYKKYNLFFAYYIKKVRLIDNI